MVKVRIYFAGLTTNVILQGVNEFLDFVDKSNGIDKYKVLDVSGFPKKRMRFSVGIAPNGDKDSREHFEMIAARVCVELEIEPEIYEGFFKCVKEFHGEGCQIRQVHEQAEAPEDLV